MELIDVDCGRTPTLDEVGVNLTALARMGQFSHVTIRQSLVDRVCGVLLRCQKANPLLLGEAGVGKTSLVKGLARWAATPQALAQARAWRIVQLPATIAEAPLRQVLEELRGAPNTILFMDEVHHLAHAAAG